MFKMEPSSHFRFAFLVLMSLLLEVVAPTTLSKSCAKFCKEKLRESDQTGKYTLFCGYRQHTSKECGPLCATHCISSDCPQNAIECTDEPTEEDLETAKYVFIALGVIGLVIVCASVGACVYCCVRGQRRQPVGPGGTTMAPGAAPYGQPQPQMAQMQTQAGAPGQPQQPPPPPQSQNPFLRAQQTPATPQPAEQPAKA